MKNTASSSSPSPSSPSPSSTSRRSVIGLLGAAPVAGGLLAAPHAAALGRSADSGRSAGRVPPALRPGGELDRHIADLAARDAFSGSVLLTHRGREVLARSHGMANKELSLPNGPDTIFCLGSIPKLFTAVAIGQLAERGAVAYHEKVGAYLDGFPREIAETVTVHHLLTHTAGMGDFHGPGFHDQGPWDSAEAMLDAIVDMARATPLRFPPGSGYAYSNTGFCVLGAIVAAVTGRSYFGYVDEHIFRAAGMTRSGFFTPEQWRDDRRIARPYLTTDSGERVDALPQHRGFATPAGSSFASCPDLARFARALVSGALISRDTAHLTLTPKLPRPEGPLPGTRETFVNYGSMSLLCGGRWMVSRNGGSAGVSTQLFLQPPGSDWVFVALTNYDEAAQEVSRRALELITAHG